MTGNNTKAERSHHRALPIHYMTAFCNHALVTEQRMASPLDFTPEFQEIAMCLLLPLLLTTTAYYYPYLSTSLFKGTSYKCPPT